MDEIGEMPIVKIKSQRLGYDHISQHDLEGTDQGKISCWMTTTKDHQESLTIHWIFKLLSRLHSSLLANHPTTPKINERQHSVCVEKEVWQGFWFTKDKLPGCHQFRRLCTCMSPLFLKFDFWDSFSLGDALSQHCNKDVELHPVAYLCQ